MRRLKRNVHHELRCIRAVESAHTLRAVNAARALDAPAIWTERHLHPLLDNFGRIHDEIVRDCGANSCEAIAENV